MTIDASGNVGIGTTSPENLLTIRRNESASGGAGASQLALVSGTGGNVLLGYRVGGIDFLSNDLGVVNTVARIEAVASVSHSGSNFDTDLVFSATTGTAPTEYMRINSEGNVGIGTTNPSAKLEVADATQAKINVTTTSDTLDSLIQLRRERVGGAVTQTGDLLGEVLAIGRTASDFSNGAAGIIFQQAGAGTYAQGDILFNTRNSSDTWGTRMTVKSDGNVGIGTTAPDGPLTISEGVTNVKTKIDDNSISFSRASDGGYQGSISFNAVDTMTYGSRGPHRFTSNGAEVLTVLTNGNVGIGTASPGAKLDISAGTNLNLGVSQLAHASYVNEGIGLTFTRTTSDSDLMGIGVVDSDKLGLFSRQGIIFGTGGSGGYDATTEVMRIVGAGNVGIGTTNPSTFKLQVAGNVGPETDSTYDLGSAIRRWATVYAGSINATSITENGTTLSGQYFKQGGNSFATLATLGTNDANDLTFETNNARRMTIDTSGNVGIGDTAPGNKLDVAGNINIADGNAYRIADVDILKHNSTSKSVSIGEEAGSLFNATGLQNTAIGYQAGYQSGTATTQDFLTAIGSQAGWRNTGDNLVAIGYRAGYTNSGDGVIAIGTTAGFQNTGVNLAAFGISSAYQNTGNNVVAFGASSAYQNTGSNVTVFGASSAAGNTSSNLVAFGQESFRYRNAANSVAVGYQAGFGSNAVRSSISNSTFVGYRAGYGITTGSNNLLLGYQAGDALTSGSNNIAIGYDVDLPSATASNQLNIGNAIYGNLSTGNVGIGTTAPASTLHVYGQTTLQSSLTTNTLSPLTSNTLGNPILSVVNRAASGNYGGMHLYTGGQTSGTYIASSGASKGAWSAGASFFSGSTWRASETVGSALVQDNGVLTYNVNMAQTVGATAAMTELFRINSDGKVGIGTSSPSALLHLQQAANTYTPALNVQSGGSSIFTVNTDIAGTEPINESFVRIEKTLPATHAGNVYGVYERFVSNGTSTRQQVAHRIELDQGYEGNKTTTGLEVSNNTSPTGGVAIGISSQMDGGTNTGSGANDLSRGVGMYSLVKGPVDETVGVWGTSALNSNISALRVGVAGFAKYASTANIGGYFALHADGFIKDLTPTAFTAAQVSSALVATNGTEAANIFTGYDNETPVFSIVDGGNVGIGTTTPSSKLTVSGDGYITGGLGVGKTNTTAGSVDITGKYLVNGTQAIYSPGGDTIFFGDGGGSLNQSGGLAGQQNTGVGMKALRSVSTGYRNMAIGYEALEDLNTGNSNVGIGYGAGGNITSGGSNLALGALAMNVLSTGQNNTALGQQALFSAEGSRNVAIGDTALRYYTGNNNITSSVNNVGIGASTKLQADGDTNSIVIGYNATGNGSNSVTLGADTITKTILKGNVGIGTSAPATKLEVSGFARFTNSSKYTEFNPGGSIFMTHGTGASYETTITNNYNTYDRFKISNGQLGNYLHVVDPDAGGSSPFQLQLMNSALNITSTSNVGIGTTNPSLLFQVAERGGMGSDGIFYWGQDLTGNNRGTLTWDTDRAIVSTPNRLDFRTNSLDRVTIDSSGNVGIGTTSPSTFKLEVAGNVGPDTTNSYNLGAAGRNWGCLYYNGGTLGTCASDERLKSDIETLSFATGSTTALDKLALLDLRSFEYKSAPGSTYHGLIAQQVRAAGLEVLVSEADDGYLAVRYGDLQWVVIEAMQDMWKRVQEYFDRTEALEEEVKDLKQRIEDLERGSGGSTTSSPGGGNGSGDSDSSSGSSGDESGTTTPPVGSGTDPDGGETGSSTPSTEETEPTPEPEPEPQEDPEPEPSASDGEDNPASDQTI